MLVLPNIEINLPQVYMCSPSWTLLPPPSPYHPSGSSQCTSPKHPVSCIEPGLATRFIYDIIHVSIFLAIPHVINTLSWLQTELNIHLITSSLIKCFPLPIKRAGMWVHRLSFFRKIAGKGTESTQYLSPGFLLQTKLRFVVLVTYNKIYMGILYGSN